MSKLFKTLLLLAVLVAIAAGLYALARNGKGGDDEKKLVTVEKGSITEKALAVGQIQPRQKFSIKSKISGIVKRCMVNVGDKVKAGDPLFEIAPDPTPQELTDVDRQLDSTKASYDRAKADFERAQELVKQGVIPKSELDVKREAFELAKVAVARAEQGRDLTRKGRIQTDTVSMESIIRAPASGTVLTRAVNPGEPVVPLTSYQPGTELAAIADMSDLIFKGTVDEIDVGKLKMALPARIKVGALPTDIVTGRVARIAPQAQQKDGATLFDIEIELDPGTKVTLRAGYSANADLIIRERNDVLTIPERVIIFEDGGKKTFVEVPGQDRQGPTRQDRRQAGRLRRLERRGLRGSRQGGQGPRAAAQEADLRGRLAAALRPRRVPPDVAGHPEPEAPHLPDGLRDRVGHGVGQPAPRLRQGTPEADDRQQLRHRRRDLHRLAGADLRSVRRPREGPQDPPERGRRRSHPARGAWDQRDLERVLEDAQAQLRRQDDRDRHLRRVPRVRRDAQPHSAGRRPLHQSHGHRGAAARPLPGQQDDRGHLRQGRERGRQDGPAGRLAVSPGWRSPEQGPATRATAGATTRRASSRARPIGRSPARSGWRT